MKTTTQEPRAADSAQPSAGAPGREEYREQMRPKAEALVDKWIARGESPSMSVDSILDEWWVLYAATL